jgi:hypothetical protein
MRISGLLARVSPEEKRGAPVGDEEGKPVGGTPVGNEDDTLVGGG